MIKNIQGQKRVVIEHVYPEIDCGEFPAKRVVGERFTVRADIYADGHDEVKAVLLYREAKKRSWKEVPMQHLGNDRWEASFIPENFTDYEYTLAGWIDHFSTWQHDLQKKHKAGQNLKVELQIGGNLINEAVAKTTGSNRRKLEQLAQQLLEQKKSSDDLVEMATSDGVTELMYKHGLRDHAYQYTKILSLQVDRKKALFSSWYELFPRSAAPEPGQHGTFKDVQRLLPEIAKMGFDVLYFPPISPIGKSFRKGKNNAVNAQEGEPGSPWAIGAEDGGHTAIHKKLGTENDIKLLVEAAKDYDIEIALDIAFQCSQDHPWVKEHPQWFKWRPDGTVQYAENPPKKYQDVLPINFETEDWQNLWQALKGVFDHWIERGVRIFRVDNPHTKPFVFWRWCIGEIRKKHPEVIFLAEAFTRPRIMERLAKGGYPQSYTYFTWRNTKEDFIEYLTELTKTEMREYFRPNFWPNTPDILPVSLQHKGEAAFITRAILAGTLSSNWGIYGPVFEFGINEPHPDREEYIDNEKYEIKRWEFGKETRIKTAITKLNQIRKENPALQTTWNIEFLDNDNSQLLSYLKWDDARQNLLIVVVSLDDQHSQAGWVRVPLNLVGATANKPYKVTDLLSGSQYQWQNEWNYVELHPADVPAHIFRLDP